MNKSPQKIVKNRRLLPTGLGSGSGSGGGAVSSGGASTRWRPFLSRWCCFCWRSSIFRRSRSCLLSWRCRSFSTDLLFTLLWRWLLLALALWFLLGHRALARPVVLQPAVPQLAVPQLTSSQQSWGASVWSFCLWITLVRCGLTSRASWKVSVRSVTLAVVFSRHSDGDRQVTKEVHCPAPSSLLSMQ